MRRALVSLFTITALFFNAVPLWAGVTQEFTEYEKIVLSPLSDPMDTSIPNWRELYLAKIAKYEAFLKKYPNSPLTAEVKLRIAEFLKDVERPEIYPLRVGMYRCVEQNAGDTAERSAAREACIVEFNNKTKKWRDPAYSKKAVELLLELVQKYGHQKRYNMSEPRIGGFSWVEEEIGAKALYLLSKGADPQNKKKILLLILKEYKAGPDLAVEIKEDLERLKNIEVQ